MHMISPAERACLLKNRLFAGFSAAELDELVEKTFEGSLPAFIAAFARKTKLSQDEVDRLRAMIDGYEEKRP